MTGPTHTTFPNIRKPCSSSPLRASIYCHSHHSFLHSSTPFTHTHQHTNLSLLLTVLCNTCPSTTVPGHSTIPPIFCYGCKRGFTSCTSSSCSSGLLATLLALQCKYLGSFINTTPSFPAILLSTTFLPITYPIILLIKWNTVLLSAVYHFPLWYCLCMLSSPSCVQTWWWIKSLPHISFNFLT